MKKTKLISILVIVCALVVVFVQNRNPVQAHFLLITVKMLSSSCCLGIGRGFARTLHPDPHKEPGRNVPDIQVQTRLLDTVSWR